MGAEEEVRLKDGWGVRSEEGEGGVGVVEEVER